MPAPVAAALGLAVLLSVRAAAQTPVLTPREMVRRSVEMFRQNAEAVRHYTYLMRQDERQLDSADRVTSRQIRTWDVTQLEGVPYSRLVAREDRSLSPKEQQLEEEKLRRSIEERRRETPEQRARRIADWERAQQRRHDPLREVPDAFDFQLRGEESLNGIPVYVVDATPHPGYRPKGTGAAFLPKVRVRFWIVKDDYHWAKIHLETLDTVTFGGFLLRLAKGSHVEVEQTRVNNEVWLLKNVDLRLSARLLLLKSLRREYIFTFSNYKKFQADSRIVE